MDLYRAVIAIVLSFLILVGYQYYFVKPVARQQAEQSTQQTPQESSAPGTPASAAPAITGTPAVPDGAVPLTDNPAARDITITTPLYTLVIDEQGGGFKSFTLANYRRELAADAGPMQLIHGASPLELPAIFSVKNGKDSDLPLFQADQTELSLNKEQGKKELVLRGRLSSGLRIERILTFDPESYLIGDRIQVQNDAAQPLPLSPAMLMSHTPFSGPIVQNMAANQAVFHGPVVLLNNELQEVRGKDLKQGVRELQGDLTWAAFEDNYFIAAVIPQGDAQRAVAISATGQTVRSVVSDPALTLQPGEQKEINYLFYFGPKRLSILQSVGFDLARAINFGWFDVIAKPMLWLLNFFYGFVRNYGVAIILLTVMIKLVFWPITQKGMKSMKNMQKLQPKVAKLKEKFKDDPARMNQEMMSLYKTYKVNPVGGCLPLVLQIPFFFALYKVLLLSIELRHAPFMLWINDLSAPDRLWLGFDIPWLHGLPVLTLLMGASMFLQQKMTPTTADPTQAKIMQWLPIVFTFMFINFASGLVLYWFVNNLLSILQQQLINRQTRTVEA